MLEQVVGFECTSAVGMLGMSHKCMSTRDHV